MILNVVLIVQADELQKVYEPYVNFFESVKNEIARCEAEKPRFLALLRIAQCKAHIMHLLVLKFQFVFEIIRETQLAPLP